MRTVGEVLQQHGPQFPKDILKLLPGDLFREATHHAEKLTLGTLNKKLDMRDTWKRYVEPEMDETVETGKWRAVASETVEDVQPESGAGKDPVLDA